MLKIPVGWLQLKKEKIRFLVAVLGVTLAVVLILVQIGFRDSMLETSLRYHQLGNYQLALVSPTTTTLIQTRPFSSRRLYQVITAEGVEQVTPVYAAQANWKDPASGENMQILAMGVDPALEVFDIDEINEQRDLIKMRDFYLFDTLSRPEFGPVVETFQQQGVAKAEVNDQTIEVRGLFTLGTSFGINGSIITSADNFTRLFPSRNRGMIDVGFVRLKRGVDAEMLRDSLNEYLPADVRVMTKQDFKRLELDFWNTISPVGGVFGFGIVVGLVVGAIIVYQILFADVNDHMAEYATLKAMGYSNLSLSGIVIQQAIILAVLGFIFGFGVSWGLYGLIGDFIKVEMEMTLERGLNVLGLTLVMCAASALLAQRKLWSADPAEIF
jgi:putative ABC transport system permease protein